MLHTSLPEVAAPSRQPAVAPLPNGDEESRRLRVLVVDDQEVVHWGFKMLPARERQVLEMIASGSTNREIAERLFLSPHTVKDHTSALYRKIGARNRAQAILRAQRLGMLG